MRTASDGGNWLEDVFNILRFRRRGVVSFRKFVMLNAWSCCDANALRTDDAATQPLRVDIGSAAYPARGGRAPGDPPEVDRL
jgi:hypothetical protein